MFLSAVSVLVVAQSSSEIPEGLMNNPVLLWLAYSSVELCFFYGNTLHHTKVTGKWSEYCSFGFITDLSELAAVIADIDINM